MRNAEGGLRMRYLKCRVFIRIPNSAFETNPFRDGLCTQRYAAIIENRSHVVACHAGFERQQGAQLRISVLLDDEEAAVCLQESRYSRSKWECSDAHVVDRHAACPSFRASRARTSE